MKTFALCAILVVAGLAFGWIRRQQFAELRRQNEVLRETVAEVERYKTESAGADESLIDTNELIRLRGEWAELMKMRSQIGRWREAARIDLARVRKQADTAAAQAAQEQKRGLDLIDERAATLHSKLVHDFLNYSLVSPLRVAAKANGGRFPSSLGELEKMAQAVPEREQWICKAVFQTNQLSPRETEIIGRTFNVSAGDFEFISAYTPLTTRPPPRLLLRERSPRGLPDGRLARWYGFTDGRVEECVPPDGDFSRWEQQRAMKR